MGRLLPILSPSRKNMYRGGEDSAFEILEFGVPLGINYWEDDFQGAALQSGIYTTATNDAGTAAAITVGALGGRARWTTGTTTNGSTVFSSGLHYRGDRNAAFYAYIVLPAAITGFKFEMGFSDTIAGTDNGLVATKATPTFNATDAACLVFDTTDDTALTLVGVKAGTAATAIDFSTALAAATGYWMGVVLRDDRAKGFLYNADGDLLEQTAWQEDAITETVSTCLWVYAQTRNTTSKNMDVDRIKAYQRQTTSS